ncbi:hypothetical protein N9Y26_01160 [bacterium]|nr:hypothetical protein [bacterium]
MDTVFLGSEIIARFRSYVDDYQIYNLTKKIKVMWGIALDYENINYAIHLAWKSIVDLKKIILSSVS